MTAPWQTAWTQGGRRGIQLGNTAEFAAQFSPRRTAANWQHRYAALAMFLSPHPAVVLLPGALDRCWTDLQRQALSWDHVEVHTDVVGPSSAPGPAERGPRRDLSAAVLHRPALLERLRRVPGPLHPWGHTPDLSRLAEAVGRAVADDVRVGLLSGESKTAGNTLLRSVAARHPAIEVPEQHRYGSLGPAARAALRTVRRGRPVVVKSDHGAGGAGVVLVTPDAVRAAGGEHAFRRTQLDRLEATSTGPYVVEPLYRGIGPLRDLTVDVVIDGGGEATTHLVGVAEMDVQQGRYRGADVGPGAVPQRWADPAGRFALDVGRALARHGYRGWFDVDLVLDRTGQLVATEINCRFTGPGAAFCIAARLDAVRGRPTAVRLRDELPLPAHLPEELLYEHLVTLTSDCARIGVTVIPTLVTPVPDPAAAPGFGLALAADDRAALDQAEWVATAAARRWSALAR